MKIKEVITTLERFAPLPLQEDYDNAGLQAGLTTTEVSGVLLCLDVTEAVMAEAVRRGCNLVVAHHPLIFGGLTCLSDTTFVQRCLRAAVRNDIAVYAAHTNLDNAPAGVNFRLAEKLGLQDAAFLLPTGKGGGSGVKGTLPQAMEAADFLQHVKETFGVACLQHNELLARPIQTVALCGGAGGFLLSEAVRQQADAFLTGEMHYHTCLGQEQQIQLAVLGHYQSEQFTIGLLADVLSQAHPKLPVYPTEINTNPIKYV